MTTTKLSDWRDQINQDLDHTLSIFSQDRTVSYKLHQAMRYSVLNGGKRIRPLLVYAAGHSFGVDSKTLRPLACAIECMHAYSLIHDDLPAMDDDAWRRGKPTCHVVFGEALAILAGNALQALAFETITAIDTLRPQTRLHIVQHLAHSSGSQGMLGGQALDILEALEAEPSSTSGTATALSLDTLQTMHTCKTALLIHASLHSSLLAAELDPAQQRARQPHLKKLGLTLGLLFQLQDDIMDAAAEHDPANKLTYPARLGIKKAKALSHTLAASLKEPLHALSRLTQAQEDTGPLEQVIDSIMGRHEKEARHTFIWVSLLMFYQVLF